MSLMTTGMVFMTSARSPSVLATNRGKVINQKDPYTKQIPVSKTQVRRLLVRSPVLAEDFFSQNLC